MEEYGTITINFQDTSYCIAAATSCSRKGYSPTGKQLKKEASKSKNRGNRAPSGFAKPSKISKELCSFMGKEEGAEVARTEVTKFVISYIKDNSLAESKDIKPDEKLAHLLGTGDEDKVTYFNIQKYMNKHFTKASKKKTNEATV